MDRKAIVSFNDGYHLSDCEWWGYCESVSDAIAKTLQMAIAQKWYTPENDGSVEHLTFKVTLCEEV